MDHHRKLSCEEPPQPAAEIIPMGMPSTEPMTATVLATAFKTARSRRPRRTEATNVRASATRWQRHWSRDKSLLPRRIAALAIRPRRQDWLRRLRVDPRILQHPPHVHHLLLVDVVMSRDVERLGLRSERLPVAAVGFCGHDGHAFEKR